MPSDPDESKVQKGGALYTLQPGDSTDARCGGCAHFVPAEETAIDGALCKVVAGEIEPDAVCRRFYADFGVFADNKMGPEVRISSVHERGGVADWTPTAVERFISKLRGRLAGLTTAASVTKRELFAETIERSDEEVEALGIGPGSLPDRGEGGGDE